MTVRRATWCLVLGVALVACSPTTARQATTPSPAATAPITPPSSPASPTTSANATPTPEPSLEPVPPPSLVCSGRYQAGHHLVVAPVFSQAGYTSLDVLDVADPLAPVVVCTINNAPYPIQPVQWLSPSDFALVAFQPYRMLRVDISGRSITTDRQLKPSVVAALSPDRAWIATMEFDASGVNVARLYGPSGMRTLASYPAPGGHGGTIYGFGGPKIEFSPDGTLVLAVDYEANRVDSSVSDLQVFDLQGARVFSAAQGTWAVWVNSALYYTGGDQRVYRWVRGAAAAVVLQVGWIEPTVSPDGQTIAFLSYLSPPNSALKLQVLDSRTDATRTLATTDLRIDPLFVTASLVWVSELVTCDNCYGGNTATGKVFAYDLASGSVSEVKLPEPLSPLAGSSLSPAA